MTDVAREQHLIRMVGTAKSVAEVQAMRQQIISQGEAITTDLLVAMMVQIDRLERSGRKDRRPAKPHNRRH